jgi:hypothetical protein
MASNNTVAHSSAAGRACDRADDRALRPRCDWRPVANPRSPCRPSPRALFAWSPRCQWWPWSGCRARRNGASTTTGPTKCQSCAPTSSSSSRVPGRAPTPGHTRRSSTRSHRQRPIDILRPRATPGPPQGPLCQVPAAQPDGRHRAVAQMTVPSDPELAESGEQVVVGEKIYGRRLLRSPAETNLRVLP